MYGNNYNPYQPYYATNGAMPDMLNQYKGQYQPMGQQSIPNMQNAPNAMAMMPQPTSDLLWVLNEMEATAFPVLANNRVTLWDKNKDTVYIKSVDAQGVPSMRILDYVERVQKVIRSRLNTFASVRANMYRWRHTMLL